MWGTLDQFQLLCYLSNIKQEALQLSCPENWTGSLPIFWYVSTIFALLGAEIKTPPSAL